METYENLLREHHTTMTPLDISSLWNDSYVFKTNARMVRYHLRKLNIKCSHQHTWNLKNEKKKRAEAEKRRDRVKVKLQKRERIREERRIENELEKIRYENRERLEPIVNEKEPEESPEDSE